VCGYSSTSASAVSPRRVVAHYTHKTAAPTCTLVLAQRALPSTLLEHLAPGLWRAAQMADELSERERALRRLPLPYSLALRLRDAGVAADVISQYVNVERAAVYCRAEAKIAAPQKTTQGRYGDCR
jgi:hypothetical protein